MVTRARRGASSLGCLVSLLLFVAALYYGINIGEIYIRYDRLLDEMKAQARVAPRLTDDVIEVGAQSVNGDACAMVPDVSISLTVNVDTLAKPLASCRMSTTILCLGS